MSRSREWRKVVVEKADEVALARGEADVTRRWQPSDFGVADMNRAQVCVLGQRFSDIARVALITGVVLAALSLGATIKINNQNSGVPGLWSLVGDLPQLRETVDLKAAGIGEHGARPADEAMQPVHAPDGLMSRAKIEVISVAENDLCTERFDDVLRHGFHAASRSHGHEHWRFHGLVGQVHLRAPPAGVRRIEQVECEAHLVILAGRR